MCGDSKNYYTPDAPAEAVKNLCRPHPVQPCPGHVDSWQAAQRQRTRWLVFGSVSCDETGSVMKLLGSCVNSLLLVQWLFELLVQNKMRTVQGRK